MNYEQKYNNAIESIKRVYDQADSYGKELMEKEFLELRESEDERIRKALLELVRQSSEVLDKQNQNNMIAWLEKQEQKPRWKPTQEQMYILNWVANTLLSNDGTVEREAAKILNGLYNGLKSL